jgi:hypothetical protein
MDLAVDALPRDGDWVRVPDPPGVESRRVVSLEVVPGAGPGAGALQYGITPDRMPYGGWMATTGDGASLSGALLLQTRYDRNVALGAIAGSATSHLRSAARRDVMFAAVWVLGIVGMLGCALWLRSDRWPKGAADGR